jgi:hypothetical protein
MKKKTKPAKSFADDFFEVIKDALESKPKKAVKKIAAPKVKKTPKKPVVKPVKVKKVVAKTKKVAAPTPKKAAPNKVKPPKPTKKVAKAPKKKDEPPKPKRGRPKKDEARVNLLDDGIEYEIKIEVAPQLNAIYNYRNGTTCTVTYDGCKAKPILREMGPQ